MRTFPFSLQVLISTMASGMTFRWHQRHRHANSVCSGGSVRHTARLKTARHQHGSRLQTLVASALS
jgi:hypothetical protein